MLIELFGRNFGSFWDEFRLSMLASDIDPESPRGTLDVELEGEEEPLRLLRCAAIYGPNASGKSTVLEAANALAYLIATSGQFSSDQELSPYGPFLLDEESSHQTILLGLRGVVDCKVYEYSIEFNRSQFVSEKLVQIGPQSARPLFVRDQQNVTGPWTDDDQFELLSKSFRPNALLLSLADRLTPALAQGIAVGLGRLLRYHDPTWQHPLFGQRGTARRAADDRNFESWLVSWLREADTGIVGCEARRKVVESLEEAERVRSRRPNEYSLDLFHAGSRGPVRLDYSRESAGTRRMVELAPFMHDLLHGIEVRTYFIDELGASIHPTLLAAAIRRFNCEAEPESVRGQLVFATQETILLDAEARDAILRRDQVFLTEKDSGGASRLYSVAEFKERNNLNLRRRYLHGRYGALPAVGLLGD